MTATTEATVPHRKVAKGMTERRILDALSPEWRLVRINWKKHRIHLADRFGRIKIVSLPNAAQ